MAGDIQTQFSGPVLIFHERVLPERATLAGYAALIDAYNLTVPLPRTLSATSEHHRNREDRGWRNLYGAPRARFDIGGAPHVCAQVRRARSGGVEETVRGRRGGGNRMDG